MCHPDVEFQSVLGLTGRAYIGHDGIREYFDDAESAWEQWDVEIEQVTEAANGRVAIVMTMHARGKESGAGLAQRTAHVWTLKDGKLAGNQPHRNPELALQTPGPARALVVGTPDVNRRRREDGHRRAVVAALAAHAGPQLPGAGTDARAAPGSTRSESGRSASPSRSRSGTRSGPSAARGARSGCRTRSPASPCRRPRACRRSRPGRGGR